MTLTDFHETTTKHYTQKQWDKFPILSQEILTDKFNVIITDHQTKQEKRKKIIKPINFKNFDKGMTKFNNAQKTSWSSWDKGFKKAGMNK